jgi:hypothetical protein
MINIASGGNFWPVGDIADHHEYPHPNFSVQCGSIQGLHVQVVGEYGGHGFPTKNHLWEDTGAVWGYGDLPKTLDELKGSLQNFLRETCRSESERHRCRCLYSDDRRGDRNQRVDDL